MIHVLTLSWNGLGMLKQLKPTLEDNLNKAGSDWRWYIRSNGCTDGTQNEVISWHNVDLMNVNHNRDSFSVGVNSLFGLANPSDDDLVLLLNNDVKFKNETSISDMVSLMDKAGAAVVGARLMFPDSGNRITHAGVVFDTTKGNMPWHHRVNEKLQPRDRVNRKFQAVTGACLLTTASAFRSVNGLEKTLIWSFDDIDYCLKLSIDQKQTIAYCGTTEIEHGTSVSLNKNPVHKLFMQHNVNYFKNKWFGKYEIDYLKYQNNINYNEIK